MERTREIFVEILAAATLLLAPAAWTQPNLSRQDSLSLALADTVQLRRIATEHRGEFLGAQARFRLAFAALECKGEAVEQRLKIGRQDLNTGSSRWAAFALGVLNYDRVRLDDCKAYMKEFLRGNPPGEEGDLAKYCLVMSQGMTNDPGFVASAHAYLARDGSRNERMLRDKDVVVRNELARYHAERREYTRAIAEAQSLVKFHPQTQYARTIDVKIAEYLLLSGDEQSAIGHCAKLLERYNGDDENAARARNMLAGIFAIKGDYPRAREEYRKVIDRYPGAPGRVLAGVYGLASLDLQEARTRNDTTLMRRAFAELEAFVNQHPTDHHVPSALMEIADGCKESGNLREALAAYNRVITFDSLHAVVGSFHPRSHDLKAFRSMVIQAHMQKGLLLLERMNEPASATKEFEAVLSGSSDIPDALLNEAQCLIRLGRISEARGILERLRREKGGMRETAEYFLTSMDSRKEAAQ